MTQNRDAIYETFQERVNLQPKQLEEWLETDESKSVGDSDVGESTGHRSGRRIVEIKRTLKADLTDSDYDHMSKVNGFIARHLAQRPTSDIRESAWRYSLMNWGHDPLED